MTRLRRLVLELVTQVAHVDAQVVAAVDVARPPDLAQQLAVRQHAAGVGDQHAEQAVCDRGQMHFGAALRDDARRQVDPHVAELEHRRRVGCAAARAAQVRADPRHQLRDAGRLGQVVVGAGIERAHLVGLVAARRQHDDGSLRPGPQLADVRLAVAVGQPEVQDHDIGRPRAGFDQALLQSPGFEHAPLLGLERCAHEAADLRLVLDDQCNSCRLCHWCLSPDECVDRSPARTECRGSRSGSLSSAAGIAGGVPSGNVNSKRAPRRPGGPPTLSARMRPPCASTIARQIASPRPTPGVRGLPDPVDRASTRYACTSPSTRSALRRSASSRSAFRLPLRKKFAAARSAWPSA